MKNLFFKFENLLKKWYNLLIYFSKELNTKRLSISYNNISLTYYKQ